MELQTLILLCTGGLALLIIICSFIIYNGLNWDIHANANSLMFKLQDIERDIASLEHEVGNIDTTFHCNFPDPDDRDDDYF